MGKQGKRLIAGTAAAAFLLLVGLYFVGGRPDPPEADAIPETAGDPDGFTFFDIHAETRLTDALRQALEDRLGSDAIAYRMPFSLEINEPGFLKAHFPDLHRLNQALNAPFGERREHNTVTLMYRRARGRQVPFEYVELIFSNYSLKPLHFRIVPQGVGPSILETLTEKYGPPGIVTWQGGEAQTLWWERSSELLLTTIAPDRFGKPSYWFQIVFSRNLKEMLEHEKEEQAQRERQRRQAGEDAF